MSLVSLWKLDGNSNDSVGSNNGSDTSMTYGVPYIDGTQAGQFSGSGYITLPFIDLFSYTNFSISVWVYWTAANAGQTFFSCSDTDSNYGYIWLHTYSTNGDVEYYVRKADSTILYRDHTTAQFPNKHWHHFVVTDANGTVNFYANGKLQADMSGSYSRASVGQDSCGIGVLYRNSGTSAIMLGALDDVRLYDSTLSLENIRNMYEQQFAYRAAMMSAAPG